MLRIAVLCLLVLLSVSEAWSQYQLPPNRRYPSALTGIVIAGPWEAPTDQDTINQFLAMYGSATADDVKRWEFENTDIFTGSDYGLSWNQQKPVLGYLYVHTIIEGPDVDALKKRAVLAGVDYEDFSLHYNVDTIINTTSISVTNTFWAGVLEAGVTDNSTHYGIRLVDVGGDAFRGVSNGGAFFVWAPLPFVDIHVTLSRNGVGGYGLVIEYPSQVDANDGFKVTQWSQATILEDTTNNFSQSGTIRIAFPANWKYAALYPPHAFYSVYLRNGGGTYALRIKCFGFTTRPLVSNVSTTPALEYLDGEPYVGVLHEGTAQAGGANTITLSSSASSSNDAYKSMLVKITGGTGAGQVRVITAYTGSTRVATVDQNWETVPDSTSQYKIVRRVVRIRGWDPANDRNGDGWVDDSEYANLANPNATARFRHYARLIHTNAWSVGSTWNVANVWNSTYRQMLAEVIRDSWQASGIRGAYIDDATGNGLGSQWVSRHKAVSPAVIQGGYIAEYSGGRVDQDSPTNEAWYQGYAQLIQTIKQVTGSSWVGANIANSDPFTDPWLVGYLDPVLDWYLCEDTLHNGWAADGWGGISLRPGRIYPALSYRQKKHLMMGHVLGVTTDTNTQETWERKLTELTVLYYLVQVPGQTYMQWWNATANYGSGNTSSAPIYNGFWKAGVPRNYAYRPHGLLSADIGVPENTIPEGKRPMDIIDYVPNDLAKVGDSTSTVLTHPTKGNIPTVPTCIYILHQIDSRNYRYANGGLIPYDAVYARNYTKGIVLYRTLAQYSGLWSGYENGNPVTVQLPGVYRRVNYDGTLGPPVTEVQIRGFEGIILVKAVQTSNPNIQLSLSVDKPNPKPLEVVTVTVVARNTDTAEASNVEIRLPIPNMTYEQGSLSPQGYTVDTSDSSTLKITVPSLAAGAEVTLQFRLIQKRGS